jgi:hypothetical protein
MGMPALGDRAGQQFNAAHAVHHNVGQYRSIGGRYSLNDWLSFKSSAN